MFRVGNSDSIASKPTNFLPVLRAKSAFKGLVSIPNETQGSREEKNSFIRSRFSYKECVRFVADPNKPRRPGGYIACYCGELEYKHYKDHNVKRNHDIKWLESQDIKVIGPTNAFGQVEFSDSHIQKPAEFVRISDEDRLEDVMTLIKDHWKMMEPEKPNLCISVIGVANDFFLEGHRKDVFYSGFLQAARSTKAWILTSGLNFGVAKIVGNALQDQNFYFDRYEASGSLRCLGIAPWGYVFNRETLISEEHDKPIRYEVSEYVAADTPVYLNPNHTHYVFVDDGYRLKYSGSKSAEFRAKLEQKIALPIEGGGFGIPVVLVVVEIDYNVCIDVKNSIEKNVPVVICSGTGRTARLFELAVDYHSNYDEFQGFSEKEISELKRLIIPVYGDLGKVHDIVKMIEFIVQKTQLITIFDMSQSSDLDLAILSALIKASSNSDKQLELAFTWERSHILEEKIFREGQKIKLETLEHYMLKALKDDKLEFVKILLRNGVTMKTFLTVGRLRELYNDSNRYDGFLKCLKKNNLSPPSTNISHDKRTGHTDANMQTAKKASDHIGMTSRSVVVPVSTAGGSNNTGETTSSSHIQIRLPIINKLLDRMLGNFENLLYESDNEELFLWAVLHQRQQMALYFWECSDNPLILALIGCCLYSNMIESLPAYDTETRALYESYVTEFERVAVRLLDLCYETDEKLTLVLLEREAYLWGHFNCMRLAAQSVRRKFISCIACQDSLHYAWHQGIRVNIFILLCALLCPPLLFSDRLLQLETKPSVVDESQSTGGSRSNNNNYKRNNNNADDHLQEKFTECDKIKWKFRAFYSAPRTKFAYNAVIYVLFVLFFSYTLMFETLPDRISIYEFAVITYFAAMLIDLIRQIVKSHDDRYEQFHLRWNHNYWNKSDLLLVGLASVSALLRIGMSTTFLYAKSLYAITLVGCYLRIYGLYSHHPRLGPKLVMIRSMLVELLMFIFILVIVLVGYGVSQQVLLYPYRANFTWTAVRDVFAYPYWNLFGELTLEYAFAEKDGCTNDAANKEDCPTFNFLSPLFLAIYLMLAAILLMNLLIAIFSNVFEKIEENSIELWKFNILSLVLENSNRPILPVPFSAITAIIEFILYCLHVKPIVSKIRRILNRTTETNNARPRSINGKIIADQDVAANLLTSEEKCTAECYRTCRLVPDYLTFTPKKRHDTHSFKNQFEWFNAKKLENYCRQKLLRENQ
ncbi:unnamed protein product [Heterobilharzia americana]|nr:unnamed protein product [Heterobilharzia americana]